MGTFHASLRAIGDVRGVPATVELEDGKLSIAAGEIQIGSWPLKEIELEPIPTGYRLAAEGDQIIIELNDVDSFSDALDVGKKRRPRSHRTASRPTEKTRARAKPAKARRAKSKREETATAAVTATMESTTRRQASEETTAPVVKGKKPDTSSFLAKVDSLLEQGEQRFGERLPAWVFTRGMLALAVGLLVVTVVFPGLISTMLLIAGLLLVLFGAIVYSDNMLAVRFLRGGLTPTKVLIVGVAVLLAGVLVGMLAR